MNRENWALLNKVTLVQVITFNRRRVGDVEGLAIETYNTKNTTPLQGEVLNCLTKLEQYLCRTLTRVETRGKRGRKISIILTEKMKENRSSKRNAGRGWDFRYKPLRVH